MSWDEQTEKIEKKEVKEQPTSIEFKPLKEVEEKRGLKIGIYGDYATGKTHFALTAPEPIYIIDTEMGASPLAYQFSDKDIRVLDVAEKDGSTSFEKIQAAVDHVVAQKNVGTIVLDSVTDLWAFAQEYAKVKIFKIKPQQRLAQQWDWGVINKLYMNELLKLLRVNCNLILTARATEVYAGAGQPTGMMKPQWQKKSGFWMDFVLNAEKKLNKENKMDFLMKVDKSRPVGSLMGKTFANIDFNKFVEEVKKAKEKK